MTDRLALIRTEYEAGHIIRGRNTIGFLLGEIERLQERRNRVRSDFDLGDPPLCEHCCTYGKAVAIDTGDGWAWGWECECQRLLDDTMGDIDWPFVDDVASAKDWKLAGFEVV